MTIVKCQPGCACGRHTRSGNPLGNSKGTRPGAKPCEPGCTCKRHNPGEKHWNYTSNPSYVAKHKRWKKIHGSASARDCVDCSEPAMDWSQIHGSDDFEPRCRSCHVKYDAHQHIRDANGKFAHDSIV